MSSKATPVPSTPTRRRSHSLSQEGVDEMANRINKGMLKPGEKLPTEAAIMHEMDVSRTVVRAAMLTHLTNSRERLRRASEESQK